MELPCLRPKWFCTRTNSVPTPAPIGNKWPDKDFRPKTNFTKKMKKEEVLQRQSSSCFSIKKKRWKQTKWKQRPGQSRTSFKPSAGQFHSPFHKQLIQEKDQAAANSLMSPTNWHYQLSLRVSFLLFFSNSYHLCLVCLFVKESRSVLRDIDNELVSHCSSSPRRRCCCCCCRLLLRETEAILISQCVCWHGGNFGERQSGK